MMEAKRLLRAENYSVFGDIKMQPQYPQYPQYPQQYPVQPQQYQPYGPPSALSGVFTGKAITGLILGLVAGILILVAVFGQWCGGTDIKYTVDGVSTPIPTYGLGLPSTRGGGIGDIQNFYSDLDSWKTTITSWGTGNVSAIGEGGGAKYSALYTLIPCGIIVLLFAILCPFTKFFAPRAKKTFSTLIIIFSIIGLVMSILGIVFVVTEKPGLSWTGTSYTTTYPYTPYTSSYVLSYPFKIGYAGIVGLVGSILGLVAGIMLKPKPGEIPAPAYRPYAPQPPTAPQYYPPQQPPVPPRQYP